MATTLVSLEQYPHTTYRPDFDELKARILKGIAEINADPVVHRWKNFDALNPDS